MARSLSWIDPDHLANLIEVVSPGGSRSAGRDDDSQESEDPVELSALFDRTPEPSLPPLPPLQRPAPRATSVVTSPAPSSAMGSETSQVTRQVTQSTRISTPAKPPPPAAPAPVRVAIPAPAPATIAAAAFQPGPDTDLATRLEEFTHWVVGATRLDAVFITDANGLLVTERGISGVESALTASVDLLLNHVSDVLQGEVDGYVALQRGGLHIVTLWTPTVYGRFYGVLISKAALHPESLILADQGFRTLFAN